MLVVRKLNSTGHNSLFFMLPPGAPVLEYCARWKDDAIVLEPLEGGSCSGYLVRPQPHTRVGGRVYYRLTLPKPLAERMGLRKGSLVLVYFDEREKTIVVRPAPLPPAPSSHVAGAAKG